MTDPATERRDRLTLVQFVGCAGCGSLILGVFLLLGWTVFRADERILSDPQQVAANLQAIVPCTVPTGYRGFRGINDGARRIALLAPNDYGGTRVPVDRELTIGVWTFPAAADPTKRREEMVAFWEAMIRERLGHSAGALESSAPTETTFTIAGKTYPAQERVYTARTKVRLLLALVVRGERTLGLTFVGKVDGFDEKAMTAFLGSLP